MNLFQRFWQKRRLPCAAVIVAAGAGERMQGKDKIMSKVGGKPVIAHTIAAFESSRAIDEIVVVARREQVETVRALIREYGFEKVKDVVPGGKTRVESVHCGLNAMSKNMELAAIQDGARPLVTPDIIERAVMQAVKCHAAAPAIPVKDTIKVVDDGLITDTPHRPSLYITQTPQVFRKRLYFEAVDFAEEHGLDFTRDDVIRIAQAKWPSGQRIMSKEQIQKAVEAFYDVAHNDLVGSKRNKELMEPRHVAIWMARELTDNTLADIGKKFGGRSHATVKHSIHWVEDASKEDRIFQNRVESLKECITDNS